MGELKSTYYTDWFYLANLISFMTNTQFDWYVFPQENDVLVFNKRR